MLVRMRGLGTDDEVMSLKRYYRQDRRRGGRCKFVAYSAVSLNEKPVDGQSIWENLTEKVSGMCVAPVAEQLLREQVRG